MGREERKLKKALQQREKDLQRKLSRNRGFAEHVSDEGVQGLVTEIGSGYAVVDGLKLRSNLDAVVGDQVLYSPGLRRVERVLPRRTVLGRPDPSNPRIQKVLAANIDTVVNVVSAKDPRLRPGLIDRYLIVIENSGASPLICVTKIDLAEPGEELNPYRELGVPVIQCSVVTGYGIDTLAAELAGRICVFTGQSGVGKSSLLNALCPDAAAIIGEVCDAHHRGRHTTTGSKLYRLPNGSTMIDTPGIRELGLWQVDPAHVRRYFHEFDKFACQFADCTHTHEPRCGVKEAVNTGEIAEARYRSYVRIRGG